MSTSERTALFLRHIVDATDRIHSYVDGLDEAAFLANQLVQDAVVRNYFSIDYALVWNTVNDDLPTLRRVIASLLI